VAPIDGLGLAECGLVGHSMGGAIAVHVAAVRPAVVDPHGIRAAHLGITRLVDLGRCIVRVAPLRMGPRRQFALSWGDSRCRAGISKEH